LIKTVEASIKTVEASSRFRRAIALVAGPIGRNHSPKSRMGTGGPIPLLIKNEVAVGSQCGTISEGGSADR
jgi:hypothetical protein